MDESTTHLQGGTEQLISGCIRGDRSAQAGLYELFCNKMMGVCLWYAKSKPEAEEILQDGFMRVFQYLHTYTGEGALEGWIRKIMINAALQKLRSKKTNVLRIVEYSSDEHDEANHTLFISQLDEKELLKLIQMLPPVYRMVFNLFVLEGMKHKEIAELLGISEGTSKSNLADARAILQKKIIHLQKTATW